MSYARLTAAVALSLLTTGGVLKAAVAEFESRLRRPESADLFAGLPDSVARLDPSLALPGPVDRVLRFAYPEKWLEGSGARPPLVLLVNGRPAAWLAEEPRFEDLSTERPYGYMRLPGGQSIFVVCPMPGCATVTFVQDEFATRWVQWSRQQPEMLSALALFGLCLLLVAFSLAFELASRLSTPSFLAFTGFMLVLAVLAPSAPLALLYPPAFLTGVAAWPMLRRQASGFLGLARRGIAGEASPAGRAFRGSAFLVCAFLAAIPGIYTTIDWYPSEYDDSSFYTFAASRFLRTPDLWSAAFDPSNWKYSAYPLILAVFSKALSIHPMDGYVLISFLGPVALSASAGAFAWIAAGRFSTGLLAVLISGLWGGLGGYAWLGRQASELAAGRAVRLIDNDYYEPAFFGEFTGPYSEIAAYLQAAPFYPREAGLVPFWIGLGLLYRRLKSEQARPTFIPIFALFIVATAIYPYYGIAAPLALLVAALAEGGGDASGRANRRRTLAALAVLSLLCGVLGDIAARWYRGESALAYLTYFFFEAPLSLDKSIPSLDFLLPRILSGEFFFALAFALAFLMNVRPRGALNQLQLRAALVTLLICIAHGFLNQAGPRLHLILQNFRWFVSWRSLLTPVMILAAALLLERAWERASRPTRPLVVVLAILPMLSPALWALSSKSFLDQVSGGFNWRGFMAPLWASYREHGRERLGRVNIPEPMIIEGATIGEGTMAMAAFGIRVLEFPSQRALFENHGALLLERLGTPLVASAAVRRDGSVRARIDQSRCCTRLTWFGDYEVYGPRALQKVEDK